MYHLYQEALDNISNSLRRISLLDEVEPSLNLGLNIYQAQLCDSQFGKKVSLPLLVSEFSNIDINRHTELTECINLVTSATLLSTLISNVLLM